jgi:DNA-directed RNA polymerase specialized sigma24 family protein
MAEKDAWEQCLYRFARVLLLNGEAARKLVIETLEESIRAGMAESSDRDRVIMLQFQDLRRRALKIQPAVKTPIPAAGISLPIGASEIVPKVGPDQIEAALHGLPEPGRSAYTLLLLDTMDAESIATLLDLEPPAFAEAVHGARLATEQALATIEPEAAP